jgi:imidazolonepropionase-like amidohydrolase
VPRSWQHRPNKYPSAGLPLTHASLIDVVSGTLVQDVTVVIAGERIVSVDAGRGSPPDGADAIDGRGAYLIPGLWDMHVHVSYARASSLPVFVANGVTAVRDMGSELAEIDQWRGQIAANGIIGPTIIRAGPILNCREFNRFQLSVANEIEARTAVRTLQKAGVDLIKMHRQASREAYFAAADEARTLGLPFSGHIPVTVPPLEAADARPASIEHTETLFEGTFATEHTHQDLAAEIARWRATQAAELFAKFARNNIAVDPTLSAQEYIVRRLDSGQPDPNERYIAASALREGEKDWAELRRTAAAFVAARRPLLREMQAVTALMQRSNVMLITGTDTSFIHPPGFTLHDELRLLVDAGLTPAQALQAATVNCAKLFSTQQAGSIAAGKRADIVLLSANPLEDIRNTRRIRAVVVRGRYLDRQALDRVLEDASRFARTS